jgi:UDP-N-acetylglucosamine--N-acetylmuramyl-(pentapeptide) pyrophosphoryl-undecaprenol N-acetylglucosamine transferase
VWFGRAFTQEATGQKSREQLEAELRGIPFFPLPTSKLASGTGFGWSQFRQLWRATRTASALVSQTHPDVYVSFGGYLSVPTALACWWHRVPILIHEQTRHAGLANKFVAKLADHVFVADEQSQQHFAAHKTSVIGNLLRTNILEPFAQPPLWFTPQKALPLLYIAGGSQGSMVINECLAKVLPELATNWQIVHQCGPASETRQPLTELEHLRETLPQELQSHYAVREWLEASELNWILHHAALYVGRSGANTVWEIAAIGVPSIFIPLPNARDQEQLQNAHLLAEAQSAVILEQTNLTPQQLLHVIEEAHASLETLTAKAKTYANQVLHSGTATLAQYLVEHYTPTL